jgi:hypothetical protein
MFTVISVLLSSSGALVTSRFHQLFAGEYSGPKSDMSPSKPVVAAMSATS